MSTIRLGTRRSRLAVAQAELAADALRRIGAGDEVEIVALETRGDEISRRRPSGTWVASDGQFTSDLEQQLVTGEVDAVVHSYKDLPTESDGRLVVAAVLERGDPADCLITANDRGLEGLSFGARVGTSSARRAAQLAALRPDVVAMPIRGNVESRIARVLRGELEAVLLAAAGLERLAIRVPSGSRLSLGDVLPAPAQGALAIQVRRDQDAVVRAVGRADHGPTRVAVEAERALLRAVGGGCLAPLGALAEVDAGELRIRAAFEAHDGQLRRADERGSANDPGALVARVAARLLAVPVPA